MGVPVVARVGRTFCRRQAGEYLTKLGLPELICNSWDDYKKSVVDLAYDPDRLSELRSTLRPAMQEKMLDYDLHAKEMMVAYDHMWELFSGGQAIEAFNVIGTEIVPLSKVA